MNYASTPALESLPATVLARPHHQRTLRTTRTWAVILAGGEGRRLRPLVRRLFGDDRPKQYTQLIGPASLLRQTLDRVGRLVPAERTVVVSRSEHARYIARELGDGPAPRVLLQPEDRGTSAAVLFAAHMIRRWDADATLAVFPSDHFIREEDRFLGHLAEVVTIVERHPEWMVLLGARPSNPELEYGWIKPGMPISETSDGLVSSVRTFLEKPSLETAQRCLANGWLWNTFAFVTTVPALLEAAQRFLPAIDMRLRLIDAFERSRREEWAIRQAFALAPTSDFSRDVLAQCPASLAVSVLPPLTWSDLGTPRRVVAAAGSLTVRPIWMTAGRRTVNALTTVLQESSGLRAIR